MPALAALMRNPSNPASCDETTTMSPDATGVVMCRLNDVFTAVRQSNLPRSIEADDAIAGERHDLFHAGQPGRDRSRVTGDIVLRSPEDLAAGLVEADDARPMPPADAHDDPLSVHQRRARIAVTAGALGIALFADEDRGKILDEVDAPQQLAVGRIAALELAAARLPKTRGPSTTGVPRGPLPWLSLIVSSIAALHSSLPSTRR